MKSDLKNRRLRNIFENIGSEFGYNKVDAAFIGCKDFKVRWQRTTDWISFSVSDYLADAPEEVLEDLGRMLFERITGRGNMFSEKLIDWFRTSNPAGKFRDVFLSRSRNLAMTSKGDYKDLQESFNRLVEMGLVDKDMDVYLTWSKNEGSRKMGQCSVLMKVVSISKELDKEHVPEHVLDWCLYSELCHLIIGYDPTGDMHEELEEDLMQKYDNVLSAEKWLDDHELIA